MDKFTDILAKALTGSVLVVAAILVCAAIGAFPVKWCWNATMPELFHLPEIGVVKAFCLVWLAEAFFKASASAKRESK